ncbi:MAG: hypothetical protein A2898_03975 [Candidatus Kerfeldbacteria bacterium RIFCSPLOWO2_01_FULL_48_11]|uniref:Uncharacterized protein n=1 Tax=Candidatus Kerfeldbacteria bacterium RIFCSPLOWO2_01_FULL_48_11 TaxID=1798543 RepID=A0A1G2B6R5_9BACT|nr:MAG: hypothetical protein UY34_C0004G0030 [Parcubacteria group bacterium GW2011_GWA2_48_9]KKW14575.1 MAG: hypothetical protein UY52_C0024G0008 [Parcubacteria group bacterium GW2011_GWC2_49_9]OGY84842.1 MAG: hypothetical protein A2898_03975 [Candidatus Kerfeldbacteria bacterium RIFCSPLOWO2_01_FULL_48_11]HCM67795.1 hypothetical protein [Candidatus Kerfeldbacteria bacterium]
MSRKFFTNLTAPERLMTVTVVALAAIALLAFVVVQKDKLASVFSPDEAVNAPLSFDTPKNITAEVIEVNADTHILSVDTDIEDAAQTGIFTSKQLTVQVNDDTKFEKFDISKLYLNVAPQSFALSELEPGTAIVISSKDNPQAVTTIYALAVRQYFNNY